MTHAQDLFRPAPTLDITLSEALDAIDGLDADTAGDLLTVDTIDDVFTQLDLDLDTDLGD